MIVLPGQIRAPFVSSSEVRNRNVAMGTYKYVGGFCLRDSLFVTLYTFLYFRFWKFPFFGEVPFIRVSLNRDAFCRILQNNEKTKKFQEKNVTPFMPCMLLSEPIPHLLDMYCKWVDSQPAVTYCLLNLLYISEWCDNTDTDRFLALLLCHALLIPKNCLSPRVNRAWLYKEL